MFQRDPDDDPDVCGVSARDIIIRAIEILIMRNNPEAAMLALALLKKLETIEQRIRSRLSQE